MRFKVGWREILNHTALKIESLFCGQLFGESLGTV